jgi:phage FluMu protein Com
MPIRFRCVYCDKLLGIAKRKAGAVVNCPQCGQPLIVPTPEPEPEPTAAASQPAAPAKGPPKLFEQDDFDALLEGDATFRTPDPPAVPKRPKAPAAAPPATPLPPRPFAVERSLPPAPAADPTAGPRARPQPRGLVLSTGMLILALVLVLVLLGVAFGGGLLVGRLLTAGG